MLKYPNTVRRTFWTWLRWRLAGETRLSWSEWQRALDNTLYRQRIFEALGWPPENAICASDWEPTRWP